MKPEAPVGVFSLIRATPPAVRNSGWRSRSRIVEVATNRPIRPVVGSGAQSAAEMFMAVHNDLPQGLPTIMLRSIGLQNYQTSKFVNEVFFPSFVDEFYTSGAEVREQILDEVALTNYAGLAPPFLDEIYSMLYQQKMLGHSRSDVRPMTEVDAARMSGGDVLLDLRDRMSGKVEPLACDLVLGTWYEPGVPRLIRYLAERVGIADLQVSRRYRLDLGRSAYCAVYLQGVDEQTLGIADSLISVLAHRFQDIVYDLLDRRDTVRARTA